MVTITMLWIFRRKELLEEGLKTIEQTSQNMILAGKVELVTFSEMMQHEHCLGGSYMVIYGIWNLVDGWVVRIRVRKDMRI